jgi:hypothetical protein
MADSAAVVEFERKQAEPQHATLAVMRAARIGKALHQMTNLSCFVASETPVGVLPAAERAAAEAAAAEAAAAERAVAERAAAEAAAAERAAAERATVAAQHHAIEARIRARAPPPSSAWC